ncbi:MAG: 4'-phosphopantetheinyl transferase superfamily protein [Bacteroidota bacterium]
MKFRFEKDRSSFVVTRATLRSLLGLYLGIPARTVTFTYSKYGKPSLSTGQDLYFNVSHSGLMALAGFSIDEPIGVDIEERVDSSDLRLTARRVFTDLELAELNNLAPEQYTEGFYNAWTRKEAFIKAVGHGLSFPLKEFSVSLAPNKQAQLLETKFDPNEKEHWTMKAIDVPSSYHAAFATRSTVREYVFRKWKHQRLPQDPAV